MFTKLASAVIILMMCSDLYHSWNSWTHRGEVKGHNEFKTIRRKAQLIAENPLNCKAAGFSGGCCDEAIHGNCIVGKRRQSCSCRQECYTDKDSSRPNENSCCDDILDIQCYPRNCEEAGLKGCNRSRSNDCSLRLSPNGNKCFCDANCSPGCCPPDDDDDLSYIKSRIDKLKMEMIKIRKMLATLQEVTDVDKRKQNLKETAELEDLLSFDDSQDLLDRKYEVPHPSQIQTQQYSRSSLYEERRQQQMLYLQLMQLLLNQKQK